jgi:hypothetical protein
MFSQRIQVYFHLSNIISNRIINGMFVRISCMKNNGQHVNTNCAFKTLSFLW